MIQETLSYFKISEVSIKDAKGVIYSKHNISACARTHFTKHTTHKTNTLTYLKVISWGENNTEFIRNKSLITLKVNENQIRKRIFFFKTILIIFLSVEGGGKGMIFKAPPCTGWPVNDTL